MKKVEYLLAIICSISEKHKTTKHLFHWECDMQKVCEIMVKLKTSKGYKDIVLTPDSLKTSKLGFWVDYKIYKEI